ncbi:MAG: zinc ribbon domain-containing protein [Akkermansiaceae bacterium]|nr:zinc ribbon domain-containing protein [Akkermansiaceae bacterium]
MWKCDTCGEEHEDQFTSCWKCSADEGESPGVGVSPETYAREESIDEKLARRFTCPKCSSTGAESKRIATTGTGLSKMLDIQHNTYISLSCRKCGFTEFYDADMLRDSSVAGTLLDIFID